MEWTREKRYRRFEDESPEAMQELMEKVNACPWRQSFHIQPTTGLLNDPNGFAFYNGYYHLFYQWFPMGPVHGLKLVPCEIKGSRPLGRRRDWHCSGGFLR
jgi:beta-fructofuranosidase